MRNVPLLLILLFALASCDLFKLREAEPPDKPAPWNSYATNWDLCLQNLEYCYEDSRNAVKYSGLFTPDFSFRFAAQDVNDYNLPQSWNSSQEQDMLLNLFSQTDSTRVTLTPIEGQADEISASEAKVYRGYELTRFPSGTGADQEFSGELEIHFRKSGAYWYIYKWFDYRTAANPTWGRMKYDFSQ
jgi:hypothetical protein